MRQPTFHVFVPSPGIHTDGADKRPMRDGVDRRFQLSASSLSTLTLDEPRGTCVATDRHRREKGPVLAGSYWTSPSHSSFAKQS